MTPLFKKLNFKNHPTVFLLNAPPEFSEATQAMSNFTQFQTQIAEGEPIQFFLAFVIEASQIETFSSILATQMKGDAIIWFAYPKKSSKKYKAEVNRDYGWESLGKIDMEGVRAVAIDQDWSALRFRRVEYIKKLTRNPKMILSEKGKNKKQ